MGQKQTCAAHGSCPPRAKGGSHFKVCWAGKLVCCKSVMERSESNFLFRAYVFANASAASEAIIGRRLGNLAMGSV